MSDQAVLNTDREIWRERYDDYYADSIHVTERGGIGINCGGMVYVKPVREWHKSADTIASLTAENERLTELANKRWREVKALQAALEPFATAMDRAGAWPASACKDTDRLCPDIHFTAQMITFGDLRRARAALQSTGSARPSHTSAEKA